jgi:hypothetical protein
MVVARICSERFFPFFPLSLRPFSFLRDCCTMPLYVLPAPICILFFRKIILSAEQEKRVDFGRKGFELHGKMLFYSQLSSGSITQ